MKDSRLNGPEEPDGGELSEQETEELREVLRSRDRGSKGRTCPDEDRVRLLATAVLSEGESGRLLKHVAECSWCGSILRQAAEDLQNEPTTEELALAAESRWADPVQRHALAERLASEGAERRLRPKLFFGWRLLIPATALAVGIGAADIFVWPQLNLARTEALLTRAYTEDRPMELRISGAAYAPVRVTLGVDSPRITRSPDFLDAEAHIGRALAAKPNDPNWLHLQGKADMLESQEDQAITELERARALKPGDAGILLDLSAAYFQKAQKVGDPKRLAEAFEYVSQARNLKPNDPVVLFNYAYTAERIFAFRDAINAWQKYLSIEPAGGYSVEARSRLEDLKKKSPGSPDMQVPQSQKR